MQFRQEDPPATEGRAVEAGSPGSLAGTPVSSEERDRGRIRVRPFTLPEGDPIPIDRTRAAGLFMVGSKLNT